MEQKRKKIKKRWIVLIIVLVLILALAIGIFAVAKDYLAQIGRTYEDPQDTIAPEDEFFDTDETPVVAPTFSPAPTTEPSAEPTEEPTTQPSAEPSATPEPSANPEIVWIDPEDVEWDFIERIEDDHLINILLVGQDKYPGVEYVGRQRSDTMILCSINPKTGEVSLVSFLRDLYVQLPGGYSDNRLNVPYVLGGFPLLDETFAKNFGVSVDANFEIDLAGFEAVINLVGGVELELTGAEAKYLVRATGIPSVATEGMNSLNGVCARVFAQIRSLDSDFGRTNRQREVLLAIYDKIKTLSIGELLNLMHEGLSYVTTDLTDGEIISLAYRLLPLVSSMKIETYAVPASNAYTRAYVNGMDVLLPKLQVIRDQLENKYLPMH